MEFQMSGGSVPNPLGGALPERAPSRPEPPRPKIVKPVPPRPRRRGVWWGLAAVAIVGGIGAYLNGGRVPPNQGGGGSSAAIFRTAAIAFGDLHRTLRVTGSISGERFAGVIAPQLRGSRSSYGGNRMSSRGAMSASASMFGGSDSSSSSSSTSTTSSSSSSSSALTINSSNTANSTSSSSDTSGRAASTAAPSPGAAPGSTQRFTHR